MKCREPLPDGCPPNAADEIAQPRDVFRLVRTNPPTAEDFKSQWAEKPGSTFRGIDECQVRGLSVHAERRNTANSLKLPTLGEYDGPQLFEARAAEETPHLPRLNSNDGDAT